jgi:shikimate kinase
LISFFPKFKSRGRTKAHGFFFALGPETAPALPKCHRPEKKYMMGNRAMNIVLVGARCSGKTTVGKILSALTGKVFLDTDTLVEEKAGTSIEAFIAARGWEAFRGLERQTVKVVSERDDQIIATGGGVVLDEVNVNRLVPNALVVWLEGKAEVLRQRMEKEQQAGKRRPSLTGTDPLKEITEVLNARDPFYGRASTLRVDTTGLSPE